MSIVLFCPVRERPDILAEALDSHRKLEGIRERWYFDDNEDPESSALLKGETLLQIPGLAPRDAYQGHGWTAPLMGRMAAIRQAALERFNYGCDVFMIDADVLVHPKTARSLLAHHASVASEVFWSKWPGSDIWMPNVWDADNYGFRWPESILRLRQPGTYCVGGLGACTLISRGSLARGASYDLIPNLHAFPGEDRHFCIRNAALGLSMFVDTHLPAFHVYRPEMLAEGKAWKESGCPPKYFAEKWLDDAWRKGVEQLFIRPLGRK